MFGMDRDPMCVETVHKDRGFEFLDRVPLGERFEGEGDE